ncbi:ribosome biogenesis protein SLX9-domain-containing protein [Mycena galericulata]|nr:ribosome biogenesis protein SLX9-domain-containing protein [Mycena galericulata]
MPKERRKRVGAHDPSVKLPIKRQFAVQDNAVEHVDVGAAGPEQSAEALLSAMDDDSRTTLKKKEKQQLKREALLQRLESTHSPYSKSHARRQKRKAREQLGGGLDDMQLALAAVDDDADEVPQESAGDLSADEPQPAPKKAKPKPGQIGEGKGAPLSKAQRQRALQMEKLRHPLILANAEFASNPFQTIRTHAQNTLLQH